jgi:hypothetical protein
MLFLVGCDATTVPMAPKNDDLAAKGFRALPGRSAIYVYRAETYGYAVAMNVALDGKIQGGTGPQTYFLFDVDPGRHTVQSLTENISSVVLSTEPGQTYFVWQEVKTGVAQARSELHVVTDKVGRHDVQNCKLIQSVDTMAVTPQTPPPAIPETIRNARGAVVKNPAYVAPPSDSTK